MLPPSDVPMCLNLQSLNLLEKKPSTSEKVGLSARQSVMGPSAELSNKWLLGCIHGPSKNQIVYVPIRIRSQSGTGQMKSDFQRC